MNEINRIGIILKPSEVKDFGSILTNLFRWLAKREKQIFLLTKEKKRIEKIVAKTVIEKVHFCKADKLYNQMDLVISLGGDGTFLGVSRNISNSTPLFSVNLGRLGFITEFSRMDFYEHLNSVLANKFSTTQIHLSSVEVFRGKKSLHKEYFFNDAVFSKNSIARMVTLGLEIDGEHMQDITGDGVIVSSTYGSTAYSLAAGGPIVHPAVQAYILTPICPHSLTHRPVVIPDQSKIDIRLTEDIDEVNVTLDGQTIIPIQYKDLIKVQKEKDKYITIINNYEKTYFHTLKEKFVHGKRDQNKE